MNATHQGQPARAGLGLVAFSVRAHFRRHGWRWLEGALIALLAVQAARLAWVLLLPVGPLGAAEVAVAPSARINPALAAQAFGPAPEGPAGVDIAGLTLMGIRRHADPQQSSAIVADASGVQRAHGIGDPVRPGLRLKAVLHDHVIVSSAGKEHRLLLPAAGSTLPVPPRSIVPRPAPTPSAAPVDARQLVAEAGLRARMRDGRVHGYTLIPRGNGQALSDAGLQSGDVLLAVNGEQLTPERVAELGQALQSGGSTQITVERGQETQTITLQTEQP